MSKPCIVCSKRHSVLIKVENQLPVVRCRNCGLIYADAQRHDETEFQAHHYEALYSDCENDRSDEHESRKVLFKKFLESKKGKRLLEGKRGILDIGCGRGFFLHLLSRLGLKEIYGIDTSENAVQFLEKIYGISGFAGKLEGAHVGDDYFDLITLWDVLEHVPAPRVMLTEIRRILKKGGSLFIRVPNAHYLLLKHYVWGKMLGREKCFIPRFHYYNFSPKNLERILKEEGFNRIDIRPGMPEIYGSFVRKLVHRMLYAMSLLIFVVMRRVAFTCFMIEAEAVR
jgi:2-polyprenyl-3-methyl-5-hydroxy-6-metoxy-1,4-benzoquinol methylase